MHTQYYICSVNNSFGTPYCWYSMYTIKMLSEYY